LINRILKQAYSFVKKKAMYTKNVGSKGDWKDFEPIGENRAGWVKIFQEFRDRTFDTL
jgi:hypothetical protein